MTDEERSLKVNTRATHGVLVGIFYVVLRHDGLTQRTAIFAALGALFTALIISHIFEYVTRKA